ncbi:MAG: HlyC/CorC family transporter [Armatimonadetes bacterium]|nr:HlyC/CorC family transporter [Armatimonadota bacterium]
MSESSSGEREAPGPLKQLTQKLLFGISKIFIGIANVFAKPAGGSVVLRTSGQTGEEIRSLVDSAGETGEMESDETELIHSVLEFSDTVAREIMTPRTDMDAVPVDINPYDLVEIIQQSGHSRIPIYEGSDDEIVGIVHAKDLFLAMLRGKPVNISSLMRPALYVTENKSIDELLAEMRVTKSQMAIIKDEFGGTSGIVTIEDIIEELVGEIQDEHDDEMPEVSETQEGYLVEGKTHLDDINELTGSAFESEDFDTIGGFVFGLFGRQPKRGEWLEHQGFQFNIADTDGKRILKIRIIPPDPLDSSPMPLTEQIPSA